MNDSPLQGRASESVELDFAYRRVAAAAGTWSDTSANSSADSGPPFADVVAHALLHSCVADDALPPITTALHGDISANISARILRMYPKTDHPRYGRQTVLPRRLCAGARGARPRRPWHAAHHFRIGIESGGVAGR